MSTAALAGMRVLEFGSRLAVGACARLLADLGATVWVAEPRVPRQQGKWIDRALATAGRQSVLYDPAEADDVAVLTALTAGCEVILTSSDIDSCPSELEDALARCAIVCDITAFGKTGPLSGTPAGELTIQALTGVMDTTGFKDGPAVPVGFSFSEMSTGIYAAVATTIAWRVLRRDGVGQRIDMALFDTTFNALATFLPAHFAGKAAQRLGNGHSMAVPWNAYETRGGWALICSANDVQWEKLASLIDPALAADQRYATLADRLAHRDEVDALIGAWAAQQPLEELIQRLLKAGVPCGPIVDIDRLADEPNLALRRTIAEVADPETGHTARVPTTLIRFEDEGVSPPAIPAADSGRAAARNMPPVIRHSPRTPRRPYADLRVLEIGQFTTAPLVARHLATFGADVIKIEPPEGDSARAWAPHRHSTSHFFVMSNGEKRSLALDLRSMEGLAAFERLLIDADVLVENMKPGSLARLGFDTARLRALNPRLIYCGISGFGKQSAYAGRPAFDTVVQAMCGIMDATRTGGVPMKSGVSAADIGGGQVGLLAIAAALERRDSTGRGASIDIAMQDVGAWLTQMQWNHAAPTDEHTEAAATVSEACANPQTVARELIIVRLDADGTAWELLGSPLRLSVTPAQIGVPIGASSKSAITWRVAPSVSSVTPVSEKTA